MVEIQLEWVLYLENIHDDGKMQSLAAGVEKLIEFGLLLFICHICET